MEREWREMGRWAHTIVTQQKNLNSWRACWISSQSSCVWHLKNSWENLRRFEEAKLSIASPRLSNLVSCTSRHLSWCWCTIIMWRKGKNFVYMWWAVVQSLSTLPPRLLHLTSDPTLRKQNSFHNLNLFLFSFANQSLFVVDWRERGCTAITNALSVSNVSHSTECANTNIENYRSGVSFSRAAR